MKKFMVSGTILALVLLFAGGCADMKATGTKISNVALTAPALAYALDDVYAVLIAAKAVPDNRIEATKALAALDVIAPMVKVQGDALAGDQFNWASFVISAAITTAKVMGYWL